MPKGRNRKEHGVKPRQDLRFILICLVLSPIIVLASCETLGYKDRSPRVIIQGDKSWYRASLEEDEQLLGLFPENSSKTIEWPPQKLRRYVDISIDVTQSSFDSKIIYNGQVTSWAEYNIQKFCDYLQSERVLAPGDQIVLRIFGSQPNLGSKSLKGRDDLTANLAQDQSVPITNPPLRISIDAAVFQARFNDRQLTVKEVSNDYAELERATISQIRAWCVQKMSTEVYNKSPLLNHITNVKRNTDSKGAKRLLMFVTDGHIDFGKGYFSPADYSDKTVAGLKKEASDLGLKPFLEREPGTSITIFGLNFQHDERFRIKQEELLRWFFEKQDPKLILLITS